MATREMTLTKGALDKAAHAGGAAARYLDPRYPNLYLDVGARSKTWRFRKFWKGQNFTETLGTWPQMSVVEAEQTAAETNGQIDEKGVIVKGDQPTAVNLPLKAVDQNSDDLNEIVEAYLTIPGDACDAWRVISTCSADGRDLPEWVKGYLLRVSAKAARIDGPDGVAAAFEFHPESVDVQAKPRKALWDSLTEFSVIAGWRREARNAGPKLSLAACFTRHVSERLNDRDNENTV